MIDIQEVQIFEIQREHLPEVIHVLQSISKFKPVQTELDQIWHEFRNQPNVFGFVAAIDKNILAYGSITIEKKIRGGVLAHLKDIAVHNDYRELGLGNMMVTFLCKFAKNLGCYKCVLASKDTNLQFYKKCSFNEGGTHMEIFLDDFS